MNKLLFVKIIVCFLTFLLVLGAFSALGTIYKKVNEKPKTTTIELNQPKNTYIADFKIEKNDIFVLVKGKNGTSVSDKIVIVDKFGKTPNITLNLSKE
ncbi:MAG: hypothetical protein E7004_01150 [Alphaproteobacteria bacterium]|nr:hypothetical protein [Alphaproteobacteria bacterium]